MLNNKRFFIIILLILFSAALFLPGLSKSALWEEDEVWYAQVSREISASGDFATLTFGGEPFFHKPPLFYWAEAICGKLFGFNEVALRMVSAVPAILTVVLAFLIGELLFSMQAGILAGMVLATSFQFLIQAKLAYLEPLLTFFMTLAVYYFIRGYFNGRPAYYVWFYVAAALATLTKGPIGILLPGGAIFLFLVIQREWRQVIRVFFNWGLLLFAIIVSPWYIIETIKFGPAFLLENFGYHQFTRFAKGAETHAEPWYYNFVSLFLGFLPWSTFVPAGMLFAARKIKQKPILLVVLWAAVIFVFFTVSVSKLPGYLLPAFVPLSILVAVMAAAFLKNEGGITWKGMLFSFLFLAALLLALAVMFFYVVAAKGPAVVGGYGEAIKSLRPFAYLLGGGALVGLAAFLLKPKKTYFFWLLVIWVAALNIYFMYNVIPLIESFRPMKALGEKIAATAALSDRVASYNYYSRALMFYSRRNPDVVQNEKELAAYLSAPGKAYVAMYDTEYEQVKKVIGKNARVTRVIYRANHGALITND